MVEINLLYTGITEDHCAKCNASEILKTELFVMLQGGRKKVFSICIICGTEYAKGRIRFYAIYETDEVH